MFQRGRNATLLHGGLLGPAVVLDIVSSEKNSVEFAIENENGRLSKLELYWLVRLASQKLHSGKIAFAPGLFSKTCSSERDFKARSLFFYPDVEFRKTTHGQR